MDKRLTFQTDKFLEAKVFLCFFFVCFANGWILLESWKILQENCENSVKIEKNYCNNPNGIKLLFGKQFL